MMGGSWDGGCVGGRKLVFKPQRLDLEPLFYLVRAKLTTNSNSNPDVINEQWFIILAKNILYNKPSYFLIWSTKNMNLKKLFLKLLHFQRFMLYHFLGKESFSLNCTSSLFVYPWGKTNLSAINHKNIAGPQFCYKYCLIPALSKSLARKTLIEFWMSTSKLIVFLPLPHKSIL